MTQSNINWRDVGVNFSDANSALNIAQGSMSQAGTIFGQLRKDLLDAEQRRIDNAFREKKLTEDIRQFGITDENLDLDRASRENIYNQQNLTAIRGQDIGAKTARERLLFEMANKTAEQTGEISNYGETLNNVPVNTPYNNQYQPIVDEMSSQYGVPSSVLNSLIDIESGGNPNAVSPTGVRGLTQFTEATYNEMANNDPLFQGDRLDPKNQIRAAGKYMKQLYDKYGNYEDALVHYNGGSGAVEFAKTGKWSESGLKGLEEDAKKANIPFDQYKSQKEKEITSHSAKAKNIAVREELQPQQQQVNSARQQANQYRQRANNPNLSLDGQKQNLDMADRLDKVADIEDERIGRTAYLTTQATMDAEFDRTKEAGLARIFQLKQEIENPNTPEDQLADKSKELAELEDKYERPKSITEKNFEIYEAMSKDPAFKGNVFVNDEVKLNREKLSAIELSKAEGRKADRLKWEQSQNESHPEYQKWFDTLDGHSKERANLLWTALMDTFGDQIGQKDIEDIIRKSPTSSNWFGVERSTSGGWLWHGKSVQPETLVRMVQQKIKNNTQTRNYFEGKTDRKVPYHEEPSVKTKRETNKRLLTEGKGDTPSESTTREDLLLGGNDKRSEEEQFKELEKKYNIDILKNPKSSEAVNDESVQKEFNRLWKLREKELLFKRSIEENKVYKEQTLNQAIENIKKMREKEMRKDPKYDRIKGAGASDIFRSFLDFIEPDLQHSK